MKFKLISVLLFLVIMATLPLAVVKCNFKSNNSEYINTENDENKHVNNEQDDDINVLLCGFIAAQYDESYCEETVKAVAILMQTDYDVKPQKFDLDNKNIYLSKDKADNSVKEKYSDFEKAVSSVSEIKITKNNKTLYIPFSKISNGQTVTDKEYDYLSPVASPWDCFNINYNAESNCVGVSLCGLDYLCKNGMSAQEALKWYLPEFEIG